VVNVGHDREIADEIKLGHAGAYSLSGKAGKGASRHRVTRAQRFEEIHLG
jgi:hypothetical protein